MSDKGFIHPEVLVSTAWVAENLNNTSDTRLVESNEDLLLYGTGHIANAVHIDWIADLNDAIRRDYLDEEKGLKILTKIYKNLLPGGILITANIRLNNEKKFAEKVLKWEVIYREPKDLIDLLVKAGFNQNKITLYYEPLLVHGVVVAVK